MTFPPQQDFGGYPPQGSFPGSQQNAGGYPPQGPAASYGGGDGDTSQSEGQQNNRGGGGGEGKKLNPSVSFYKPRRNFNAQDPKTHGSAMQVDLSLKGEKLNCCFLNMAPQSNQMGGSNVFDWKNQKLSLKLGKTDITKLLAVNKLFSPGVELIHKSGQQGSEKTTIFGYMMVGSMVDTQKYGWYIQQKTEGKLSPYAVYARLSQNVANQQGFKACHILLQVEDMIEVDEFLKFSIHKLFDA